MGKDFFFSEEETTAQGATVEEKNDKIEAQSRSELGKWIFYDTIKNSIDH